MCGDLFTDLLLLVDIQEHSVSVGFCDYVVLEHCYDVMSAELSKSVSVCR